MQSTGICIYSSSHRESFGRIIAAKNESNILLPSYIFFRRERILGRQFTIDIYYYLSMQHHYHFLSVDIVQLIWSQLRER